MTGDDVVFVTDERQDIAPTSQQICNKLSQILPGKCLAIERRNRWQVADRAYANVELFFHMLLLAIRREPAKMPLVPALLANS